MASNYRRGGVDFDDLFDPDIVGDGPQALGLKKGGVPLRYASVAYGQRRADVGYRQNGQDVAALWAAKGTATYALGFNGKTYSRSAQALSGQTGNISASLYLAFSNNGTWAINGAGTGGSDSGSWLRAGESASDYEVQITINQISGQAPTNTSNPAAGYINLTNSFQTEITNTVNAAIVISRTSAVNFVVSLRKISTGRVTVSSCRFNVTVTGQG